MRLSDSPTPTPNGTPSNGFSNGKVAVNNNGASHLPASKASTPSVSRISLPGTSLYSDSNISREEFVRFVIQALYDVGYIESASTLQAESGYELESRRVAQFRTYVLSGAWDEAEQALSSLGPSNEEALLNARFLINRQRYLELLEAGRRTDALHILRNKLAPLTPFESDSDPLSSLSSLIMCLDPEDVRQRAEWDGAAGSSRQQLLDQLHLHISPSVLLPQRRLATLLEQARQYQHSNCRYHNAHPSDFSLYSDHQCDPSTFPRDTTTILDGHKDEVWGIAWSHDGLSLASAGKDKNAIIWQLGSEKDPALREWKVVHILRDHPDPVGCLAWSPDDQVLLTGSEHQIKVWNVKTGLCTKPIEMHTDAVSGLAYLPDGSGFISAGLDKHIYLWDAEGSLLDAWGATSIRITDIALTPDGTKLVAIGMHSNNQMRTAPATVTTNAGNTSTTNANTQNAYQSQQSQPPPTRMVVYDLKSHDVVSEVDVERELTSVNVSRDSRFAVLNHTPDEIQIWDLVNNRVSAKLHGQKQGTHIIRSCFGGMDENFVASGSEDGNVYIWHRQSEALIEVLPGHGAGCVNVVAWNPVNERMFATCSDDHTVRIWEALAPWSAPSLSSLASPQATYTRVLGEESGAALATADPKGKGKTKRGADILRAASWGSPPRPTTSSASAVSVSATEPSVASSPSSSASTS